MLLVLLVLPLYFGADGGNRCLSISKSELPANAACTESNRAPLLASRAIIASAKSSSSDFVSGNVLLLPGGVTEYSCIARISPPAPLFNDYCVLTSE